MYLKILALDFDGTLTENDSVSDRVISALIKAKKVYYNSNSLDGR
jgi:hydroxymethylpyrimidine pyrophosphatase-like HAD family hydrolase